MVKKVITNLDSSKASGPDCIPVVVLKNCEPELSYIPLLKKCPYSELFWFVFSCNQTEYGEIQSISPYLVQMQENTGHNNSKYGHFLCSALAERSLVGYSHWWSLYLKMLGKCLQLKTIALLAFYLWLVKSLKNLLMIRFLIT